MLSVTYCETFGSSIDDGSPAWRIVLVEQVVTLPFQFQREADAVRASEAIENFTDWSLDIESLLEVVQPRHNELRRLIAEAMAW